MEIGNRFYKNKWAMFFTVVLSSFLIYSFVGAKKIVLVSQSSYNLKGKITDMKNKPIKEVSVLVEVNSVKYNAQTNKNGEYSLLVPKGILQFTISHKNYEKQIFSFDFNADKEFVLDITMKRVNKPVVIKIESQSNVIKLKKHRYSYSDKKSEADAIDIAVMDESTIKNTRKVKKSSKSHSIRSFKTDVKSGSRRMPAQQDNSKYGTLTAGEINDFSKWKLWNDISQEKLRNHSSLWEIELGGRYVVMIKNGNGNPIINAKVNLIDVKGKTIWKSRTDNTGKVELWSSFNAKVSHTNKDLKIEVNIFNKKYKIDNPKVFKEGINLLNVDLACVVPNVVDVAFVVDATGSMGDEINYLKKDLNNIIDRIKKENTNIMLNLGSVFYRDKEDAYLTKLSQFSSNQSSTVSFVNKQNALGGGDYPEAVESALDVAIYQLNWNEHSRTKIMFLWLDAPPHQDKEVLEKIKKLTKKAAEKGIRIVPLGCSGINKSTEYLMRSLALATNGTYSFLTNHSGVGNSHIEPSTDSYQVEKLNDLLVRIVHQFVMTPDCNQQMDSIVINSKDTLIVVKPPINDTIGHNSIVKTLLKIYPNPSQGEITIEIVGIVHEMYLADINGKLLQKISVNREQRKIYVNLENYTSGIYYVKYLDRKKWKAKRIILVR